MPIQPRARRWKPPESGKLPPSHAARPNSFNEIRAPPAIFRLLGAGSNNLSGLWGSAAMPPPKSRSVDRERDPPTSMPKRPECDCSLWHRFRPNILVYRQIQVVHMNRFRGFESTTPVDPPNEIPQPLQLPLLPSAGGGPRPPRKPCLSILGRLRPPVVTDNRPPITFPLGLSRLPGWPCG